MSVTPLPDYPPKEEVVDTPNPSRTTLNSTAAPREQRLSLIAGEGAFVPFGYGLDRVGAIVPKVTVYNGNLVMLLVWCLGEIESVEDVMLSDGSALPGGITLTDYTGTTTQGVDATLAAAFSGWNNNLVATVRGESVGLAYTVAVIPPGVTTGVPELVAELKLKKVYDPREVGHDLEDPSTWEYSDNPALAKADFERSALYGRGRTLDWVSVDAAADACDALVGGEKRRLIGLLIDQQSTVDAWGATLNGYAKCYTIDNGDAIKLLADRPRSATRTITDSEILHDSSGRPEIKLSKLGLEDAPTVVKVIYTNTTGDQWRDAYAYAKATGVDAGTVEWRESVVRLPGIQRYSQAVREAIERYNQLNLADLVLDELIAVDPGLQDQPGDVVAVTSAIGLTAKEFALLSVEPVEPGRWRLSGLEYQNNVYSDSVESDPLVGDTSLPNPSAPPAVTGLALAEEQYQLKDGTWSTRIRATWDDPGFPFTDRYLVKTYKSATLVFTGDSGTAEEYVTPSVQENVTYTVEVCIVSTTGAVGAADIEQITAQGDYLIPGDVPSFTGFEVGGEVRLAWGQAVDAWRYEVRYGAVAVTWANATLIDRVDALRLETKSVPEGTWDFLVTTVDSIGQYAANEARVRVIVTADDDAYLADWNEFDNPTLTNMASFTLAPTDPATYYVSEDGDTAATNFPLSPAGSNYPNVAATYHDSMTSQWLSETWDTGLSISGTWRATLSDVTAVSGSYTATLELSSNGTDWDSYTDLIAKATARYARVRIVAYTTSTLRVKTPGIMVSIDVVARTEEGSSTSLATGGKTLTMTGYYSAIKSITITPLATAARDFAIDDAQASRNLLNQVGYSRDITQTSVWSPTNSPSASYNQVGIEGESNTASLITDDSATQYEHYRETITSFSADTTNVVRAYIKKDSDTSRFPALHIEYTGSSSKVVYGWLNTSTGASVLSGSGSANAAVEVVDYDANWWLVLLEVEDVDTNSAMTVGIYPSLGTVIGTLSVAATGSCIIGNVEVFLETTLDEVRTMEPVFCDAGAAVDGQTKCEFDVYIFDASGNQVANDFLWGFKGV